MKKLDIEKFRQKESHKETIAMVRYSPTGRYLVSADQRGEIVIWPEGNLAGSRRVNSPCSPLTGVWFSENEEQLLVGCQGGHLLVYGLPDIKLEAEVELKTDRSDREILSGSSRPILDWVVMAVSPSNAANLYAVLEFRDLFSISHDSLQQIGYIHQDGPLFENGVASLDGKFVFFGDELGYIYRVRLPEMRIEKFAKHHEIVRASSFTQNSTMSSTMDAATGIAGLAISADGRWIASTSREGGVQIWQTDAERKGSIDDKEPFAARKPIEIEWIRGVCFLPNSNSLVLGADNGTLEVWDYNSGQTTGRANLQVGIRSIDASCDGNQVAIGCEDGTLFLVPWGRSFESPFAIFSDWIAKLLNQFRAGDK